MTWFSSKDRKRVRIVSEGVPKSTTVIDVNTNKPIPYITGIEISIAAECPNQAVITIAEPSLDVTADAQIIYENEIRLLQLLNTLFQLHPINITQINNIVPFKEDVDKLRALESLFPDLGLADYGKDTEGISVLSLIATITAILCNGKRLKFHYDANDGIILGVSWLDDTPSTEDTSDEQEDSDSN